MKNLYKIENELYIVDNTEEINKDTKTCWCIDISCNKLVLHQGVLPSYHYKHYKKIIMTTDKSINVLCSCGKDCGAKESGAQSIDDEFLEWYVKNPTCEKVEVEKYCSTGRKCDNKGLSCHNARLKIVIPKEPKEENCCTPIGQIKRYVDCKGCDRKPKQEKLEEVAERLYPIFKGGSMWMPSVDDCNKANKQEGFIEGAKWQAERMYSEEEVLELLRKAHFVEQNIDEWFEQYKK